MADAFNAYNDVQYMADAFNAFKFRMVKSVQTVQIMRCRSSGSCISSRRSVDQTDHA